MYDNLECFMRFKNSQLKLNTYPTNFSKRLVDALKNKILAVGSFNISKKAL